MSGFDGIRYIAEHISNLDALTSLAEEASELSQACLKFARADKLLNNPTPVSREEALKNLIEEITDVHVCLLILQYKNIAEHQDALEYEKVVRYCERLRLREEVE